MRDKRLMQKWPMRVDRVERVIEQIPAGLFNDRYHLKVAAVIVLAVAAILTATAVFASVQWLGLLGVGLILAGATLVTFAWRTGWAKDRSVAETVSAMNQELETQTHRLEAFREIAAAVGQSLNLREVLELGLEKIRQITGQEAAEIHLLDPNGRTMATKASIGGPQGFTMREEVLVLGECLCGLAVLNDSPVIVPDFQNDERVTRLSCRRFGFQSAACIPLRVKGRSIGVLTVHGRQPHDLDAENIELLVAVANQLATAIENARLYAEMEARVEALSRRLQYMAVVEERERLGREMHDGLAQTLSLLSIQLGHARSLAKGGDLDGAVAELNEMGRVIDAGYEEVREAITSLRLAAPRGEEWLDWLREYVYDFGLRHELSAEVKLPPDSKPVVLPPHQEVHLTRIVQEALNNVRKHAQASQVQMALIPNGRTLTLRIQDDGCGFDLDHTQSRRGRFGLSTMEERAELAGGKLEIETSPGQGTTIIIEIQRSGAAEE
jgi:signal transduction histidine kinase